MKSIIALGVALIILLGASIGFYVWYFDDEKTYVYDYAKENNSYKNYSSTNQDYSYNTQNNNTYNQNLNSYTNETNEPTQIPSIQEVQENSNNTANINNNLKDDTSKKEEIINNEKPTNPTQEESKPIKNSTKEEQASSFKQKPTSSKSQYKSTMQEYIEKGKTSRYESRLSSDFVKVYVLNGKTLSDYRIGLLNEMIRPIAENSKDYNLTIFIQMLPNDNMNLSIYNKDIIFDKNKKKYKYVNMDIKDSKFLFDRNGYSDYSNEDILEKINQSLAREDIIKRVKIRGYADDRGSSFANYMIGLNRAMNAAKHFFTFTEVVQIQSLGKDQYPLKDKSDQQRQDNRKVEISFYN